MELELANGLLIIDQHIKDGEEEESDETDEDETARR